MGIGDRAFNASDTYAVVSGIEVNGLGVLRALGRANVPTIALDTDMDHPTAATRFGTKVRVRALAGPAFIEDLLTLRNRLGPEPILFLTQEDSVATICAGRDALAGAYRYSMPGHGIMQTLLDKLKFQTLAEQLGFPIPRVARLSEPSDGSALRQLRFPCVLKPATKSSEYSRRFRKAYKVSTAADALALWSEMHSVIDEVIVQEWIEGDDSDVYFCLQYRPTNRTPAVSFVGRKTCQWPPLVGGTASCIPAPEAASELTALTETFFSSVRFVGICSMEYKRDSRDGRFYMVEPTVGRTDYQQEIAALNGVNIPLAAYRAELGMSPIQPDTVSPPRAWRDPLGYANARAAGSSDPMRKLSPHATICDAYFRLDDPMPYFALKAGTFRRKFARKFPYWRFSASH